MCLNARTFVPFQISTNVILILTTVAIMPNVSTQTGHLFATVVLDFLGTVYFVKV